MTTLMKTVRRLSIAASTLLVLAGGLAKADLITYTETDTVSGTLGTTTFTNAFITITVTADTASVAVGSGFDTVSPLSNRFTIAGVGTYSFTSSTLFMFSNETGYVGLADSPGSILDTYSPVLNNYQLTTAIGPVSGSDFIGTGTAYVFPTTGGDLHFSDSLNQATFEATLAAVPEPSTLTLAGIASVLTLAFARARRRRAVA